MSSPLLKWEIKEGVCELSLSSTPCNEIGTKMLTELELFVEQLDCNSTSALIVHSTVPSGFSSGADLRELSRRWQFTPASEREPQLRQFIDRVHRVMDRLDTLPLTTFCAIHGVCFGGGLELALTCDVRIAEESARFSFPELRLGLIPGFGGVPRLRRDVGNSLVRELLLTGRSINAVRALSSGLVSQVVPAGQGLTAARRAAAQCTKFDSVAARVCKSFAKPKLEAELKQEKEHFLRLAVRPEAQAALKSFVENNSLQPYLP